MPAFYATITPAGYPQYPNLMVVTPLEGFMPGSPPQRPRPIGPVDPGYSPPWAQVPDPDAPRPVHPIMLPGMPGWGQPPVGTVPPGGMPHPEHPIYLPPFQGGGGAWTKPGSPGVGIPPKPPIMIPPFPDPVPPLPEVVPPPDAAPGQTGVRVLYEYSPSAGLTGPYFLAAGGQAVPSPMPGAPPPMGTPAP